jgi:4-hydroxy-4-methyl-2-oxoglutarate aldolase
MAKSTSNKKAAAGGDLTARLSQLYSGIIHDVMRGMGLKDFTLPSTIRAFTGEKKIAGPAFTMRGHVDPTADPHETLLAWTGFLSKAKSGHIAVIQPNDNVVAHMGELSGETLMLKGVTGCVIDGGVRDVSFLIEMGLPVYARYATPRDIVGYWLVDGIDVAIQIGSVTIRPGDYIIADHDGIIVIPQESAPEIIAAAEKSVATENKIRTAILGGMDPQAAYLKYGKF